MNDRFLNTVSQFDLITPLCAFLGDIFNGPAAHFGTTSFIASRRDIRRLLKRNGIKVWGLMLNPDASVLMFAVNKAQAKRTYALLQEHDIPMEYIPDAAVEKKRRRGWFG